MPERGIELIPLVGHLTQAHIRRAGGWQWRAGGRRGDLQCLLAGPDGRIQAALSALDLAEFIAAPRGDGGLAGRLPPGAAGGEGTLGLCEPAVQPLGDGQVSR